MHIGIAYDLKPTEPLPPGVPDDLHEEFDAPTTIEAIATVLRNIGHDVTLLGNGRDLLQKLLAVPPDLVFNFAEGSGFSRSREARVPAVCEMLGIPYTGSDPLALAVALEKDLTRRLVADAGVTIPQGIILQLPPTQYDGDMAEFPAVIQEAGLIFPVIAKPVFEGSSKGIRNRCLIRTPAEIGPNVVSLWEGYHQAVLIEEFIDGDEVTVGILGSDPPDVLGVMRISPKTPVDQFVYSLEMKRDFVKLINYECPAKLPTDVLREVEAAALAVFDLLGCQDVARLDFRIREGVPYFIEINPLPGLNPGVSDLCIMGELLGVEHAEIIERIVTSAIRRQIR